MKGMVFTEFMDMVEQKFSPQMLDQIIEDSDLPSGGAYTSVGTYDHAEAVELVTNLSKRSGIPVPELLKAFGQHLFGRFAGMYPQFFVGIPSALQFMEKVDGYIHVEVRKLYPDAELPKISCSRDADDTLVITYRSVRPMADLAEGLIKGCVAHFKDAELVSREDLETGTAARFTLKRRA